MRVLIIADSALAAEGIRRGLRHAPSCRVLGFANGRVPCEATIAQVGPDVVVLDEMFDRDAVLARIREIRGAAPSCKLVLLSGDMDKDWLAQASGAGIDAAIGKSAHLASIGMLVREVVAGNVFHAFGVAPAAPEPAAAAELTAREMEILQLVAAGMSNGRIAAQLWVTEQTVKFHLSNIYRKLGLANRTEASHYAHMHGLVEMPARMAVAA
jgi:DNA-binding NarL/FixJ family response regulator